MLLARRRNNKAHCSLRMYVRVSGKTKIRNMQSRKQLPSDTHPPESDWLCLAEEGLRSLRIRDIERRSVGGRPTPPPPQLSVRWKVGLFSFDVHCKSMQFCMSAAMHTCREVVAPTHVDSEGVLQQCKRSHMWQCCPRRA